VPLTPHSEGKEMDDVVGALWSVKNGASGLGPVIAGIGMLAARYEELWLIVEGHGPDRIKSTDIGFSLGGITVGGRLLVPFCDVKAWERDAGEAGVAFEMSGREAVIAPATPPADGHFGPEVMKFLTNDRYSDDIIYLSSLDGPCGDRDGCAERQEEDVYLLRTPGQDPSAETSLPTDILRVLGEDFTIGEITWAEREDDGDGNRYLNLVMSDGRYRRIAAGDLGR